jgi:valyl-tRNA synthetase
MLPKVYDSKPVEKKWAKIWQDEKIFVPEIDDTKKPFVIVIPPPNITGALHMGHALNNVLQDVLIRYNRMNGLIAYWVPGTDHGGIATQNVMEKILKTEGNTKEVLGREKFLERMWQWYAECGTTILNQLKYLGCSIDTSKENIRFTLDEQRTQAVMKSFESLWKKGLIYRADRMINWCPRCGTALSDIEVEYEKEKSKLWYVHYPLEDGSRGITIATTRPETMLGDTAVAVHPEDEKYVNLIGKRVLLPLVKKIIPVIADEKVEKSFGTGALKITPGHDLVDFEIGLRQNLKVIQVISFEGKMINCPQEYAGKSVQFARQKVSEDLKNQGYLEKEEHYTHSVGKCYRCNQHIEPLISEQWFVRMKDLALPAIEAAEKESVKFSPSSWKKPFIEWLKNIQDWCISRQIWWGHRIPVWYCVDCNRDKLPLIGHACGAIGEGGNLPGITSWMLLPGNRKNAKPIVSLQKPSNCPDCGRKNLIQDPDVLDTWFSSALWPFSVFNWPQKTRELNYYYPTSVLVTGYEILYLWVARMVMSGFEHMGEIPFSRVYIHGMVRDKHGKKMSKSLGNVIDPLVIMEKYGTDAVRFSLISQAIGGKDIQFAEESIIGGRNFINKIYNVFRFIMMNLPDRGKKCTGKEHEVLKIPTELELSDRWILHRYFRTIKEAKFHFENYDLPSALKILYDFLWDEFCDWYVELSKPRLLTDEKEKVLSILLNIFTGVTKALHPFIPFVTEEIFGSLKNYVPCKIKTGRDTDRTKFLIQENFPFAEEKHLDETAAKEMEIIMGITRQIRTIRSQFEISPSKKINVIIISQDSHALDIVRKKYNYISILAKTGGLKVVSSAPKPKHSITALYGHFTVYVSMEGVVDLEKEKTRITKEHNKLLLELAHWEKKLGDSDFTQLAPQSEVVKIKERLEETRNKIQRLSSILNEL